VVRRNSVGRVGPEDLLNFIETRVFTREWKNLGLNDDDLFALQIALMGNPKGSPVIAGTGGLRKLRFSPPEWQRGKRGALRVCYVYFEEYGIVLLVVVYAKGEKDSLSAGEKGVIKQMIEGQRRELARGPLG
jgi:hypothetical protein